LTNLYRGGKINHVDDGIATGNTLTLSIAMLKKNPAKIIVAVPVLPYDSKKFEQNTDEFIYLIAL
jgi:predicted phosphoribosyltransferase